MKPGDHVTYTPYARSILQAPGAASAKLCDTGFVIAVATAQWNGNKQRICVCRDRPEQGMGSNKYSETDLWYPHGWWMKIPANSA